MRNTRAILVYLIAVFIGAAIAAPLVWKAVFSDAPIFGFLNFLESHDDYYRYFNRCLLLLALLGLGILARFTGIDSWKEIGWEMPKKHWRKLGGGLLLGFASSIAIALIPMLLGAREWKPPQSLTEWTTLLLGAVPTAIVVALIEETLFRGFLFGLLRRDVVWRWAAVVSSLIFASLHFLDQRPQIDDIGWTSGFTAIPLLIHDFSNDPYWLPQFCNLVLSGMIMCGLWQRTGNLYCSIGVHAGWVFCIKTNMFLTNGTTESLPAWAGNGKISDGWVGTPLLVVMVWFIFRERDPGSEKPVS